MAGHGSPPAEDKANHPNRKVGRETMIAASDIALMGGHGTSDPWSEQVEDAYGPQKDAWEARY
jgi:hypothetical protein